MQFEHLLRPRTKHVTHSASPLRRIGAFVFDILVLDFLITAPFTPIFSNLLTRANAQGVFNVSYTQQEYGAVIVLFLLAYAYFTLFEFILGQTPGMMLLHITVQPALLWQHALRNAFLIPLFPFVILWITEPILILTTRQSFLERITHTRTLQTQEIVI